MGAPPLDLHTEARRTVFERCIWSRTIYLSRMPALQYRHNSGTGGPYGDGRQHYRQDWLQDSPAHKTMHDKWLTRWRETSAGEGSEILPPRNPRSPTKAGQPQLRPVYRGMRKAYISVLFQARTGCNGLGRSYTG